MATLSKEYRRQLENTVLKARKEAERGAAAALESYGVAEAKLPGHLDEAGKVLRRKLRAHGRQVGDVRRPDDSQEVEHLIHECAYEHWHRMLFARFLAENEFLIEPDSALDVDFAHCEEEAKRMSIDPWELAARFAQKMLPGIFRPDDPVLQLRLPAESRNRLTAMLASLPREVFLADDSLGWVYQFWQTEQKKKINKSEVPIGADELAPVTQLFTEDYMVEFLLHNTLGAWWTAKRRAEGKSQPILFAYLRLKGDGTPAAGVFEGWPKTVKELRVLDPCMGSGHFPVFALVILVRMRMEEEGLSAAEACVAVLRDNLFGLELDPRCTQIAAFNLALAAWKLGGYQQELLLNLACSGLGLHAKKEEWLAIVKKSDSRGLKTDKLKAGMERLYQLFQQAPYLGSLINPRLLGGDFIMAEFHDLQPLLAKALQRETGDDSAHELALTAQGVAKAAEILAGRFTLVATNVPYLSRNKHAEPLQSYCNERYPRSRTDLATVFIERCVEFLSDACSAALVVPRIWMTYTAYYETLRQHLLARYGFDSIGLVGKSGFETIGGEVVDVALITISKRQPRPEHKILMLDVSSGANPQAKRAALLANQPAAVVQRNCLSNPGFTITERNQNKTTLLAQSVGCKEGLSRGDTDRFDRQFWELPAVKIRQWQPLVNSSTCERIMSGMDLVFLWEDGKGALALSHGARVQGQAAWNRRGVFVSRTHLKACLSYGRIHAQNGVALVPKDKNLLLPVLEFCRSEEYRNGVQALNQKLIKPTGVMTKVPFDVERWQKIAAEKYPNGIPEPYSSDPTQWLFSGHPKDSDHPLQVAVARLVGYRWPRQTGSSFPDCPALPADGLEKHADSDGVVCFNQARDEAPAATRLRALMADAYGEEWSHAMERKLIAATGSKSDSLEDWLLHDFFAQHCATFYSRPFVWHIWDGRQDGFNVLVNYHKLAGPKEEGHRTLEALTYAYLGDWIARQKDGVAHDEAGADDRLAVAHELQGELKKISAGEPPYDLFIRWKPLHQQPIGWQPDINDGIRLNSRPFVVATLRLGRKGCGLFRAKPGNSVKWDRSTGTEIAGAREDFPWLWKWDCKTDDFKGKAKFDGIRWNDCHYSCARKRTTSKSM